MSFIIYHSPRRIPGMTSTGVDWVCGLAGQRAAAAAFQQHVTPAAALGQISAFPQLDCQGMFPDRCPIILQDFSQGLVIGLAGDDTPIRLDAHIVKGGCAALHPQVMIQRVEAAVFGGRIPDQALPVLFCFLFGNFQQSGQFIFG